MTDMPDSLRLAPLSMWRLPSGCSWATAQPYRVGQLGQMAV